MIDYQRLREISEEDTLNQTEALDDFLIRFVATGTKFHREWETCRAPYQPLISGMQRQLADSFHCQFIVQRIFRENGYVHEMLHDGTINDFEPPQQAYLRQHAPSPWYFRFCMITGNPEPDFYQMRDVFTGFEFLLFSQWVTKELASGHVRLWFTLVTNNGFCFQTYGPILKFKQFDPEKIFHFATILNPEIKNAEDLVRDMQENPVPYMMFVTDDAYALTMTRIQGYPDHSEPD